MEEDNEYNSDGEILSFSQEMEMDSLECKEIDLRDRSDQEITHWWKTSILASYLLTALSGLYSSISMGDLFLALGGKCILYARINLRNLKSLNGSKVLSVGNILESKWGQNYDCEFVEFGSAFSTVFSGMLFAMFLQCGRGGITAKGLRRSWEIIPIALLFTIIFFIIATVIFAKTTGGLAFFCNNILMGSITENITSCKEVLSFKFPEDEFNTNLYLEYVLVQIGTSVTFIGWFVSLNIIIFRCLLGIDFVPYRVKRLDATTRNYYASDLKSEKGTLKSAIERAGKVKFQRDPYTWAQLDEKETENSASNETSESESSSDSEIEIH